DTRCRCGTSRISIQLSSCSGQQPFQPETSSRRPRNLQTKTLGRARRVVRAHCLIAAWVWASYVTHRRPPVALTKPLLFLPSGMLARTVAGGEFAGRVPSQIISSHRPSPDQCVNSQDHALTSRAPGVGDVTGLFGSWGAVSGRPEAGEALAP